MTNAEQIETLSVVFDALSKGDIPTAEWLYRTIPGCELLPLPTAEALEEAIGLRAGITESFHRSMESDARSDAGDNFLSQHASSLGRQRDAAQAKILESGGVSEFPGLFNKATGERVPAKIITNQYGRSWMVCDGESGRATGMFYKAGSSGPRTKLAKAGLEERVELAPAKAVIDGQGKGLSGTAWVAVVRLDGGWPGAPEWRQKEGR